MLRRALLIAVLGAVAALVAIAPAHGADSFYVVTATGDGAGSCAPYPNVPGGFSCTTLRAAVNAANADTAADDIYLQTGAVYSLDSSITLTTDVAIYSGNARVTTIRGGGRDRLFSVPQGVNVTIYGLTLTGGSGAAPDGGGAIANSGSLDLIEARVTGNRATNGGGIANAPTGSLLVEFSLIDSNQATGTGGGIYNQGSLALDDSTIALNHSNTVAGISSPSQQTASLIHATIAGNTTVASNPAGVSFAGPWSSSGSLFAANDGDTQPSNCGSAVTSGSGNIEDGSMCGFTTATGLLTRPIALFNDGGMTDVVNVAGTAAKHFETTCTSGLDQRLGQRSFNAPCDAGAYEQGVPAGAVAPLFPFPTPTPSPTPPPTPTPTPTSTVTPTPTPVAGKTVVAVPVRGTVRIKLAGTNRFVDLDAGMGIPTGSTVDTKHGTVQLTSVQKPGGKLQTAIFFDGIFKLTQTKLTTDLTLNETLAPCRRKGHAAAAAAKRKPKTRKLWGSGHGSFRTRGQYSAATVRGTEWLVQDSCAGTLTRVAQGVVSVRDSVRHKTITLRAGKHYLAGPRRR